MKENIFTTLYKTFIPEKQKPVRVQAVNPLLPESKKEILDRTSSKKEWFLGKPVIRESFKHADSFNVNGKPELERIDTLDASAKKGVLERKFTQKDWYIGNSISESPYEPEPFSVNTNNKPESFYTLGEERNQLKKTVTSKEWFFGEPIVCESYYHSPVDDQNKKSESENSDTSAENPQNVKNATLEDQQLGTENRSSHAMYRVYSEDLEKSEPINDVEIEKLDDIEVILDDGEDEQVPFLDELIRKSIDITGSVYALIVVTLIIAAWVVWGIVSNASDVWQIAMQDGQSIQTYIWDTFLMRQQLDDTHQFLKVHGRLKSRTITLKKLLIEFNARKEKGDLPDAKNEDNCLYYKTCASECNSDKEIILETSRFTKFSIFLAQILGSLESITIYWIGMFVWIGCGAIVGTTGNSPPFSGRYSGDNPEYGTFSNNWQMYINTAVAIELLITSVFLENVRLTNTVASTKSFNSFIDYDTKLELKLRGLTGYIDDNEHVVVYPCPRVGLKKYISFYAGVVGNGLGLLITTVVFVAWLAVGNVMNWNDNWWLIIGTYTGLIGFIDGFILRETYFDIISYEEKMFDNIVEESQELLNIAGFDYNMKDAMVSTPKRYLARLNLKVSKVVSDLCSTTTAVVFSIVFVIALIIMGCVLHWSATAQLIANTPTMIIEGFFLLILIQAEDWSNAKRKKTIQELAASRKMLFHYIGGEDNDL